MKKITDWLENDAEDCGLCDPPMKPQQAIDFLRHYLLGEDWYVPVSESPQQVNTAVVIEILCKYSKNFRKELKEYQRKTYKRAVSPVNKDKVARNKKKGGEE